MAKIGLTGTMSVGKTTLIEELSKLPQFKDYKIAVERSKYLRDLGIPLNTDSTLEGQTIFLAERCAELFHENLLTDRTVIDVVAFTSHAKSISVVDKEEFEDYAIKFLDRYDYIFYVSTEGTLIEDNDVRETDEHYRDVIDFSINHLIKRYRHKLKNFHIIKGTTEERIQQVLNIVNL